MIKDGREIAAILGLTDKDRAITKPHLQSASSMQLLQSQRDALDATSRIIIYIHVHKVEFQQTV